MRLALMIIAALLIVGAVMAMPAQQTEEPSGTEETSATEDATAEATEDATAEATEDATAEATEEPEPGTVVEVIGGAENLTIFAAALDAAGLADTLAEGEYTVFAPRDGAFGTLVHDLGITEDDLLADADYLANVLSYHIVPGTFAADDLKAEDGAVLETLSGATLPVLYRPETDLMYFAGQQAVLAEQNIEAANGLVHVLDNMLNPSGDMTPPEPGAVPTVIIGDGVASSPGVGRQDPLPTAPPLDAAAGTVPEVIARNANLSLMVAAIDAAGLTGTLANPEAQVTVFAPTNNAINSFLSGVGLTQDEFLRNALLDDIVRYHVLERRVPAAVLVEADERSILTALPDNYIFVDFTDNGDLLLNNIAAVISVDIPAANGVVHVIDEIILPQHVLEAFDIAQG